MTSRRGHLITSGSTRIDDFWIRAATLYRTRGNQSARYVMCGTPLSFVPLLRHMAWRLASVVILCDEFQHGSMHFHTISGGAAAPRGPPVATLPPKGLRPVSARRRIYLLNF